MTFGEKLKRLRKEKGYSQEELAGLLEVSRQAVSKWESDRGIPEINQRPRCKQRGIKLAALQSSGVFDPRGSRQMSASGHLARCSRE